MIIHCSGCGKQYQIDASLVKGKGIKFNCKVCHQENKMIRIANNELRHFSNIAKTFPHSIQKINHNSTEKAIRFTPKIEENSNEPLKTSTQKIKISTQQKNKKHRFGITMRVTGIMLMVSIIPLIILWLLNYQRMVSQIHEDTEALISEAAVGLREEINEWVDVNVRIIYAISKLPAIISMDPERQKPLLKLVKESYPWMYLVFTVSPDGMNVARSDDKSLVDYHDRSYVQGALKGNQLSWQNLIGRTSHKPTIVFSTPIRREDEIVGVIAVGVIMDSMPKRIGNWRKGRTGYVFLLDENYKAISHKTIDYVIEEKVLDQDPLILAYKNGGQGLMQFTNSEGYPSVGVVVKTKLGWFLTVQQQSSEAFKILTKSKQNAIILLTATIFIVVLIAWFSGQAITKPIKNITIAADRISVGDFDVTLDTNIKNEIGDLAASIIRMKECIRLSLERLQKRHASRQKEEFVL